MATDSTFIRPGPVGVNDDEIDSWLYPPNDDEAASGRPPIGGEVHSSNYPAWTVTDEVRSKFTPEWAGGGLEREIAYKDAWIIFNREHIIDSANKYGIPADLLGCIAFTELGGDPRAIKKVVAIFRLSNEVDIDKFGHPHGAGEWHNKFFKSSLYTSEGPLKIQLGVAAEELGVRIDPAELSMGMLHPESHDIELVIDLITELNDDIFSLNIAAKHLHTLILHDYPQADTRNLTPEQFMVAGIRYNRGTARNKNDLISALSENPTGNPKQDINRQYTSYGRSMYYKHRLHVRKLLGL
jgi:hypothetical protein